MHIYTVTRAFIYTYRDVCVSISIAVVMSVTMSICLYLYLRLYLLYVFEVLCAGAF